MCVNVSYYYLFMYLHKVKGHSSCVACIYYEHLLSRSYVKTDGQSASMSRFRAHSGTCDKILLSVRKLLSERCVLSLWGALSDERSGLSCNSQSAAMYRYLYQGFTCHVFYSSAMLVYTIHTELFSVPARYSRHLTSRIITTVEVCWSSKLLYDLRSVSMSSYRAPLWDLRPDITSCWNVAVSNLRSCFCVAPSLTIR
jgi:hypothetical protein